MRSISRIVLCLLPLVVVAGCASTNVTQQTPMVNKGMARPNRIWVYNFVANPADMPANSSIGGEVGASSTPPTAEQIEEGRQLGALIAADLGISTRWDFPPCRPSEEHRRKSATA